MSDSDRNLPEEELSSSRPRYEKLVRELRDAAEERLEGADLKEPVEALALLRDAWRENASDIHLDPLSGGLLVRLRIDGVVLDAARLGVEEGLHLVNQFKTLAKIGPGSVLSAEEGRFSVTIEEELVDLRMALIPCVVGEKMAIRLLVRKKVEQTVEQLGLDDRDLQDIRGWMNNLNGMFLAAGPTGSGKTTTLYALLHQLRLQERNILTIEDPVEYHVAGVNQIQVNLEQGLDFAAGTRALLRLDPDFLLVGEIRDRPSAQAAINAAASGRILLSTLHSHDAAGVIGVLRNYDLSDLDIAPNLAMIVAQRLVRTLCPECREEQALEEQDRAWMKEMELDPPERACYPQGCDHCGNVGYRGRIGVFEVWRLNDQDYRLILDHADDQAIRHSLKERGHRTLLEDALDKLTRGIISPEDLRSLSGFGPLKNPRPQPAKT